MYAIFGRLQKVFSSKEDLKEIPKNTNDLKKSIHLSLEYFKKSYILRIPLLYQREILSDNDA